MENSHKKLQLNKETIAVLTNEELNQAVGGEDSSYVCVTRSITITGGIIATAVDLSLIRCYTDPKPEGSPSDNYYQTVCMMPEIVVSCYC